MDERATGLILRTRPLTETSLIVQWITPEWGRLATVAKGARRPKSGFRGKLDLFHKAQFSFHRSRRSDLHNLREIQLEGTHPQLRRDLDKIRQASYAVALIELSTETETPLPTIYNLVDAFLDYLNNSPMQPLASTIFALKLLRELGLTPNLTETALTPGTQALLQKGLEFDWTQISRLNASDGQIKESQRFLRAFLIYHLGRAPA